MAGINDVSTYRLNNNAPFKMNHELYENENVLKE